MSAQQVDIELGELTHGPGYSKISRRCDVIISWSKATESVFLKIPLVAFGAGVDAPCLKRSSVRPSIASRRQSALLYMCQCLARLLSLSTGQPVATTIAKEHKIKYFVKLFV